MSEEKTVQTITYDLSATATNPADGRAMTLDGKAMTLLDAVVTSFKMVTEKTKGLSEGDLNFRRLIVLKLERAADPTAIPLKSKAVQLIKDQARDYYFPGIAMQIYAALDGEPSQAQLDEV
jgi:hypothetical protein